jgi:hypothetical protein
MLKTPSTEPHTPFFAWPPLMSAIKQNIMHYILFYDRPMTIWFLFILYKVSLNTYLIFVNCEKKIMNVTEPKNNRLGNYITCSVVGEN